MDLTGRKLDDARKNLSPEDIRKAEQQVAEQRKKEEQEKAAAAQQDTAEPSEGSTQTQANSDTPTAVQSSQPAVVDPNVKDPLGRRGPDAEEGKNAADKDFVAPGLPRGSSAGLSPYFQCILLALTGTIVRLW